MECEFCHVTLSTKSNLRRHQTSSKTCIAIRREQNHEEVAEQRLVCSGCQKEFGRPDNYRKHISACTMLNQTMIAELQTSIHDLQQENDELKERVKHLTNATCKLVTERPIGSDYAITPVTSTTNTTNTANTINTTINIINCARNYLVPITQEMLTLSSDHMTLRHLQGGGDAMARLALDTTLSGDWRMAVTDLPRKKSMFKDKNQALVEDLKAREFMRLWCSANLYKAEGLHNTEQERLKGVPLLTDEERDDTLWHDYGGENLARMRGAARGTNIDDKFTKAFCKTVLEAKAVPGLRAMLNNSFCNIPIEVADEEDGGLEYIE